MAKLLGTALAGEAGQYNPGEVGTIAPGDGVESGAWSPAPFKPSARASEAARGMHLGGEGRGLVMGALPYVVAAPVASLGGV